MANPQLEDGYLPLANDIWDALCRIRIPGEVRQVIDTVLRKTWGFRKKQDWISLSQFQEATGISKPHIVRALRRAIAMNIVAKKGNPIAQKGNDIGVTYSFNKDYESWKSLPKKVTLPKKVMIVAKKGNASLPKKAITVALLGTTKDILKDNTTKDTSTKDILPAKKSADHKKAIEYWCSKYLDQFKIKYDFRAGKDGMTVKRLLATFGFEVFCQLVDRIFASDDPFYRTGGGRTLTVLSANANKLVQELARKDSFLDQLSEAGRATYLAGQEVLRARKQRRKDNPDSNSV